MKGFIRIGGASLLGIVLILGAFVVSKSDKPDPVGVATVVAAPERTTIETKDENGNGIADWKEELGEFETIKTPESENSFDTEVVADAPKTLTEQFGVAFLQDYLVGKSEGQDFSDPTVFAQKAAEVVRSQYESERHSRRELNLVETTGTGLYSYGNQLVEIFFRYPYGDVRTPQVLNDALTTRNAEILDGLSPIHHSYSKVIEEMLLMEVPKELAVQHLALVNACERIKKDLELMQLIFDDPLQAMLGVTDYEKTAKEIATIVNAITAILTKNGIVYSSEEPGSNLYIFDI